MQTLNKKVRHKGKEVSIVEVPIFATLEEMIDKLGVSDIAKGTVAVLNLANRQLQSDLMNDERAKFRPAPESKTDLRNKAMQWAHDNDLTGLTAAFQTGDLRQIASYLDKIIETQGIIAG